MEIPGYTIVRELGKGGMATVYLAIQKPLNRQVALKVTEPALATFENFAERFIKEGQIIAQFRHPQIITIYDFNTYGRYNYFSMEYLPGGTLSQKIKEGLTPERSLTIVKLIAGALAYAHQRGVIHRDIKPQNILFREDGTPVLSDFGVAKVMKTSANAEDTQLTALGTVLGSPRYMSPEQITGQTLDARSDLYSLGIVFYEMLTGQPLFQAGDVVSLALMHCTEPIPALPMGFGRFQPILEKLLAKQVANRFDSAEQLIRAIEQVESGGPLPLPKEETTRIIPSSKTNIFIRRKTSLIIGGSLLLATVALTSVVYLTLFRHGPPPDFAADIGLPPGLADRPTTAIHYEQLAIKHWQKEEFETSLELIRLGLVAAPDDVRLLALRDHVQRYRQAAQILEQARQRLREGHLEQSLQLVQEGLQIAPNHGGLVALRDTARRQQQQVEHLLAQARAFHRQGDLAGSLGQLERGLDLVPGQPDLLMLRDQVRIELENKNRVTRLLRNCAERFPLERPSAEEATAAAACYQQILQLDPTNIEVQAALERIANHYADWISAALPRGDLGKAEDFLARLSQIKPDHPLLPNLSRDIQNLQARQLREAEETARRRADEESQRKAEEEARRKAAAEEIRRKTEEETRLRAAEEAQRKAAAEEARRRAAEQPRRPPVPEAQPKPAMASGGANRERRCGDILSRITLGEPVSNQDRAFLTKECR